MPVYEVKGLQTGGDGIRPLVVTRLSASAGAEPIRGISFAGLAPRSLKDIVTLGRGPYVYNYLGRRSPIEGGAPATIVTPAIVVRDVEVRGDTRAHPRPPLYPHPSFKPAVSRR